MLNITFDIILVLGKLSRLNVIIQNIIVASLVCCMLIIRWSEVVRFFGLWWIIIIFCSIVGPVWKKTRRGVVNKYMMIKKSCTDVMERG